MRTDEPAEAQLARAKLWLAEGNDEEAIRLIEPLAQAGVPYAQLLLAWTLDTGTGQAQDVQEARRWYKRAADQGDSVAAFYLGALLQVEGDWEAAESWFLHSASASFAPADYRLALHYLSHPAEGKMHEGRERLEKAKSEGHLPSAIRLERLTLQGRAPVHRKLLAFGRLLRLSLRVLVVGSNSLDDERLVI